MGIGYGKQGRKEQGWVYGYIGRVNRGGNGRDGYMGRVNRVRKSRDGYWVGYGGVVGIGNTINSDEIYFSPFIPPD